MIISKSEQLAVRFTDCIAKLKSIGVSAEVAVAANLVMISTQDKNSASIFRKAVKKLTSDCAVVETRPTKGSYVFTIATA